nr:hypothetical protein [Tanacetum cinerariifolium]
MKAGFLDPGGESKRKNQADKPAGEDKTNGLGGFGLVSGFSSLLDVTEKCGLEKVALVKGFFFLKFSSNEGVDSVLRDGPWIIHGVPIFLNKWSPSVSLFKKELYRVPVWVKFYDVPLVAYTSDREASPKMAPHANMKKVSIPVWVKFYDVPLVAYTSDRLSLLASKIGTPMMIESFTNSMCLDSWGKRSYARILIEIDAYNNFSDNLVMNVPNLEVVEDVDSGERIILSSVHDEGQSSTPLVEKINLFEQRLLEGKCVLLDDEGKHVKRINCMNDHDSDDEVEFVDNDMARFLASNPSGVGYGTNSLLEQWRETYGDVDHEYDPYDDDLYEGQEILTKFSLL